MKQPLPRRSIDRGIQIDFNLHRLNAESPNLLTTEFISNVSNSTAPPAKHTLSNDVTGAGMQS
jgi:hypothetical protein